MEGPVDPQRQTRERLWALIEPICKAHGVDLYDVRLLPGGRDGSVVRVILERAASGTDGGVTLDDCQAVSRDVSAALDVQDEAVPAANYRLEVSSPGLDRPLFALEHFRRFAGHEAKLETRVPVAERRRIRGKLLGVREGRVMIEQDGQVLEIPHDSITKANLVYKL